MTQLGSGRLAVSLLLLPWFPWEGNSKVYYGLSWALGPNAGVCLCFLQGSRILLSATCLSFPICKLGIITVPAHKIIVEKEMR